MLAVNTIKHTFYSFLDEEDKKDESIKKHSFNLIKSLKSSQFKHLIELGLAENNLRNVEFLQFMELDALKELSLTQNELFKLKSLQKLKLGSLMVLFLFGNPLLPERTERYSIGDPKSKKVEYLSGDCDLDYRIY